MQGLFDEAKILTVLEAALDNAASESPITVSYTLGDVVAAREQDGSIDITAEVRVVEEPALITKSPTSAPELFASVSMSASKRATDTLGDELDVPITVALVPEHSFLREHLGVQYLTPRERIQAALDDGRYAELYHLYRQEEIPLDEADEVFTAR